MLKVIYLTLNIGDKCNEFGLSGYCTKVSNELWFERKISHENQIFANGCIAKRFPWSFFIPVSPKFVKIYENISYIFWQRSEAVRAGTKNSGSPTTTGTPSK